MTWPRRTIVVAPFLGYALLAAADHTGAASVVLAASAAAVMAWATGRYGRRRLVAGALGWGVLVGSMAAHPPTSGSWLGGLALAASLSTVVLLARSTGMSWRQIGFRTAATALGLAIALGVTEVALQAIYPGSFRLHRTGAEHIGDWELDDQLGMRPRLGSRQYSRFGTLRNRYPLERRPGVDRLLFVGDSVTHRGHIVDALRARYGERRFEYWNAGVEGYNTEQELLFYRRYNRPLRPDHVILTFHNNDFDVTPLIAPDPEGGLARYQRDHSVLLVNPWLFSHSYTYRLWVQPRPLERQLHQSIRAVATALQGFRDELGRDGIHFTVVLLPILAPYREWTLDEQRSRAESLRLLGALGIRTFDLLEPLDGALDDGVRCTAEPDDRWHPTRELAEYFAEHLVQHGLLSAP